LIRENLLSRFFLKCFEQLKFSSIFPSSFWQRLGWYLLMLLPSLGVLINKLRLEHFNIDEYQHTYLAWATVHFDQLQYRDIWDNHGILYTLYNSFFISILDPKPEISTIFLERYLNLALALIGFIILFEIFYLINKRPQLCWIGLLIFCLSKFSISTIEVRPDNLQCIFLFLGILLLTKAYQSRNHILAIAAGLSAACMLMTNLKSLSALFGLLVGMLIALMLCKQNHINKDNNFDSILKILTNFILGLIAGLGCFSIIFWRYGILDDYYYCNVAFNYHYMHSVHSERWGPDLQVISFYQEMISVIILQLITLGIWLKRIFHNQEKNFFTLLLITSIYIVCMINRCNFYLWHQYDLLMMPLMFYATSLMVCEYGLLTTKIEKNFQKKFFYLSVCIALISSWGNLAINLFKPKDLYFQEVEQRFRDIQNTLKPGEHIESYAPHKCAGLGFTPHAGSGIQKDRRNMDVLEKAYNKDMYSEEYIKLLNNKKVRLIISSKKNPQNFRYLPTIQYLQKNYKPYDCIWERITPFEAEM